MLCVAVLLVGCVGAVVQGQVESYALMVQQSPVDAGVVNPGAGIHRVGIGSPVTLQAVAKPGYRFLYWLGDVSDSSTNQAVVVLNAPKIVVAVFGRLEHEVIEESSGSGGDQTAVLSFDVAGGGAGGNSLTASAGFAGGGGGAVAGRPPGGKSFPMPGSVSGGGTWVPVPGSDSQVPEPATIALLGIGAVLFLRPRPRVR